MLRRAENAQTGRGFRKADKNKGGVERDRCKGIRGKGPDLALIGTGRDNRYPGCEIA